MDVHIFTLCDFAEDFGGKMCLIGTFDSIRVQELGKSQIGFSIALRLSFDQGETGRRAVCLQIKDEEGLSLVPDIRGELAVPTGNAMFSTANLIVTVGGLVFRKPGIYFVSFKLDDRLIKGIPFRVDGA